MMYVLNKILVVLSLLFLSSLRDYIDWAMQLLLVFCPQCLTICYF